MSKKTKKCRTKEKINNRLIKNETKINKLNNQYEKLKKDYDKHIIQHIIDDLGKETFYGSGRPLYTYKNIASKYNTSSSTISRIAEKNGLNRKKGNKLA
ncbi:hypothetical protein [Clostridium botulinum]|uniref:hypothetical protein n=1 Tax=Clostridium botulinum TaxID=1491 RepID=UPI001966D45C|nr:hypothetical protein [Clostridium botulinum]MBN1058511.1 hypothetical protein [Clostridium botulinum]